MRKKISEWIKKSKWSIGLAVVFLFLGFVLGVGFNFYKDFTIQFDDKIDPTNLLEIFVNVILVWIIANILDKEKQTERTSKDIIQTRVNELYSFVNDFSEKSFNDNYNYTDATSALKRLNTGIITIEKLIATTKLNISTELLAPVKASYEKLDNLLTNIPVRDEADTSEPDLKVKDNICTFGKNRLNLIHTEFDKIKDELLTLEVNINVS